MSQPPSAWKSSSLTIFIRSPVSVIFRWAFALTTRLEIVPWFAAVTNREPGPDRHATSATHAICNVSCVRAWRRSRRYCSPDPRWLKGLSRAQAQPSRVRRDRDLRGRRPRAAADRGRQEGKGAHLLLVDPARRHCRPGRGLRQEIRRQGQGLAGRFRERPAAHRERGQGPALRGRHHGRLELGARAALSREPAAGGEVARSRRHHPGGDRAAPAMGGGLSQYHRPGLQHQPGAQGQPAQDLPGPAAAGMEGAGSASRPRTTTGSRRW